jgi:hypothetical protein
MGMSTATVPATAVRRSVPVLIAAFTSLPAVAQDITFDPERVRLEVEDLRRLAHVMRSIEAGEVKDTVAVIDREYLAKASPGLRPYARRFEVTDGSLTSALAARPALYADLDALADTILAQEEVLRAGFRRLQEIFPRAAFPPVWFFAGSHGPRGLADMAGALIGSEGLTSRPEAIAPLVLHELAHFQSAMVQGVDVYQRIYGPTGTLLALALREGSAEFIAELTAGRHTNPAAAIGVAGDAARVTLDRGAPGEGYAFPWPGLLPRILSAIKPSVVAGTRTTWTTGRWLRPDRDRANVARWNMRMARPARRCIRLHPLDGPVGRAKLLAPRPVGRAGRGLRGPGGAHHDGPARLAVAQSAARVSRGSTRVAERAGR